MKLLSFLVMLAVGSPADAGACDSGINAVAVPLLKAYPPAQSFCSAKYPLPTSTVTAKVKRQNGRSTSTTTTKSTTTKPALNPTTTPKTTTTTKDAQASQWSSILSQAGAAISTFCSCIETPVTKTVCNSDNDDDDVEQQQHHHHHHTHDDAINNHHYHHDHSNLRAIGRCLHRQQSVLH
ncbi:hypothetical protein G647_03706 [Cladophialophora carrionii CBS 160.54]|uniref:Uncharacterized protein n=1 Tax=Cladophialophora carrionii CBS 160.54 TaxID=1279043 RepID=V9DEG5_9EURO|nr:uncharacterized protein G647_03706 [Cladophialophora carrionii CBS 160.54]ETI24337.1 hypothetical protein G647_03706 [Cladophialophora carrionii CBS 160.54]